MRSSSGPTVSDVGRLHGTIHALILSKVAGLDAATKQAIWLQTEQGNDWEWDNEENEILHVPFLCEDIAEYIPISVLRSI